MGLIFVNPLAAFPVSERRREQTRPRALVVGDSRARGQQGIAANDGAVPNMHRGKQQLQLTIGIFRDDMRIPMCGEGPEFIFKVDQIKTI